MKDKRAGEWRERERERDTEGKGSLCKDNGDIKRMGSMRGAEIRGHEEGDDEGRRNLQRRRRDGHSDKRKKEEK